MDDYISREEYYGILNFMERELTEEENRKVYEYIKNLMKDVPITNITNDISSVKAADVQPVKHGKWILSDDECWLTCPFCDADVDVSVGILMYVDNDEVSRINFCPNCGAKMR